MYAMKNRPLICVFILLLSLDLFGQAGAEIRLMSWNIRLDTPSDGKNAWTYRKVAFCEHLKGEFLDIIGFQEVLHNQLEYVCACLDDFDFVGVGRNDGETKGEYSPVFFRKGRFTLLDGGTFWLSNTPDLPGSVGWDAALERIVTWAKLFDRFNNDTVLVMNTHFDHVGQMAREQSAALISGFSFKPGQPMPVILMGDLNATPENLAYRRLIASGFIDARVAATETEASMSTYTGFDQNPDNDALIDYILHSAYFKATDYQVQQVNENGKYLSDHLPVRAILIKHKP